MIPASLAVGDARSTAFRAVRKTVLGLAVVAVALGIHQTAKYARVETLMAAEEFRDLAEDRRLELVVTVAVAPESFHLERVQRHGRLRGIEGREFRIARVTPAGLRALAGYSWIESIRRVTN